MAQFGGEVEGGAQFDGEEGGAQFQKIYNH